MRASDVRVGVPAPPVDTPSTVQINVRTILFLLALVALVALGIGLLRITPSQTGSTLTVPQTVMPQPLGAHHIPLGDYSDRQWLSFARSNRPWLGDPIWGERQFESYANCVGFERYIVCRNPDPKTWGSQWEYLPLLLGERSLPPGLSTQLDAPLSPIILSYIAAMQRRGDDPLYWLGHSLSPAMCPTTGRGECVQYFQRQVLRWPDGSDRPDAVKLSNLGLQAK